MYSGFELAARYLYYYLTASSGKGHGIHSPFLFDFVTRVLDDHAAYPAYEDVENLRRDLLKDQAEILIDDFGAGARQDKGNKRSVQSIARHAGTSKKFGQLLYRISRHYHPDLMIELGTSLGLSTAYLAKGNLHAKMVTAEGSSLIAEKAKENFTRLSLDHVQLEVGLFDVVLPSVLKQFQLNKLPISLAFIDGNHHKEAMVAYFHLLLYGAAPNCILIFDDIHWSKSMEDGWEYIKQHPRVLMTVDLFFMGIVFFNDDFRTKQHFVIRF